MPLVRVEVRNEYGLGMSELYKDANKEDPKALLDGVAVAGLVGILRQLGDLAEFAAEVFHGLQEQVMATSSRSHKLMVRAQKIEVAIAPLEKAILAQRSHLHYAYTTGSQWHAHIQSERNHFIYSDLPFFIMDSYEECRGPPRLHSLDKFDTGGPGSCLKRYSDPSFFRRASAGIVEAYAGNAPRDRKARRRQKKKTRIKNVDVPQCVSQGTPLSSQSGRMHYASQNIDVQTSPSQNVSKYDGALTFEMGNHPNSFGSRAVSGYGECISSPSYTVKFNGCEPEEISSQLTMNRSDTLDTSSLDEQSRALDEDVKDQIGARLASVTWDEKTEILEPTGSYHCEETMDMHPANSDRNPSEVEAANFKTDDCDNESTPKSAPVANQLDEVESETDNYMDALNTIESESETDLECPTKQEVDQFSASNIKPVDGSTHRLDSEDTESHLSNCKSHVPANISSDTVIFEDNNMIGLKSNRIPRKETPIAEPSSVPSECYAEIQSPHVPGKSSIIDILPSTDLVESDDIISPNTKVPRNLSSLNSSEPTIQDSKADTVLSSSVESQKSRSLPSGVTGVNFWTNGGLLGLQPSKPPDFSVLDNGNDDSVVLSRRSNAHDGEDNSLKPNISKNPIMAIQDPSPKFTTLLHNDQEDSISIMKTSLRSSQAHSNGKHEHTANLQHSNSSNRSQNIVLQERSTEVLETEKHDNSDVKAAKSSEYNCNNSSRMFELSNKLLTNGQGKGSYFEDDVVSSFTSDISKQKGASHQNLFGRTFLEQFGSGSPFISPSSSPPLEHMNISFQPIDGFEISKLKLKFPDGNEGQDSSRDVFPSFQLVPEESTSFQDLGLDSNDDTFSESSPHISDYCLSHYPESDSEDWEAGESPKCNNDEIYDALHRNSTLESVSSNLDVGRIGYRGIGTNVHGLENSFTESGLEHSLTDLPIFDTLDTSFTEDLSNDSETKYQLHSDFPKDPMPPPPLPPVEWRAMKPNPDMASEKQVPPFEALTHAFDQKFRTSTVTQQPKPAPVWHESTDAVAFTINSRHSDENKHHEQKDVDYWSNSNVTDEKGDFLQQIRTKSFSLRRSITDRPILAPGAPANASVTAILEKANAIRQAVGSDDGEDDDSWD